MSGTDGRGPIGPRLAVAAAWSVWALALAWYLVRVGLDSMEPCAPYWYDESSWGSASWQWAPPGWTCTYLAEDSDTAVTVVTNPTWGPVVVGLLLLALPVYALAARRRVRRSS